MENDKKDKIFLAPGEKDRVISSIKEGLRIELLQWLKKWSLRILTILAVLAFLGISITFPIIYESTIDYSSQYISRSIAKQFSDPYLKNTLQDVAKNEARVVIEKEIQPVIDSFMSTLRNELSGVENFANNTKTKMEKEYVSIESEILYLKVRNNLTRLADLAIVTGEKRYLNQLQEVVTKYQNTVFLDAMLSEIARIKLFYSTMTSIKALKATDITFKDDLGNTHTYEQVPTEQLIKDLKENPKWMVRAKAAELLQGRKEKDVPDALLASIFEDPNLFVARDSLRSFEVLTGYVSGDIFNTDEHAKKWWNENRENILKDFKDKV